MNTYPDLKLYIDGQWRKTASDMPVLNPSTEQEIGRLPMPTYRIWMMQYWQLKKGLLSGAAQPLAKGRIYC